MHRTVLLALHGPKAGEAYRLPVLRFSADLNRVGGLLLFDSVIAPENRPSRRLSARAQRRRLSAMAPSRLSRVLMLLWIFCPFLHGQGNDYLRDFKTDIWKLGTVAIPAGSAAWSQFESKPAGFGTGVSGYFHHYGVSIGDNVNGKFMRDLALPIITQRENAPYRYVGWGHGSMWKGHFSIWRRLGQAGLHSIFADPECAKTWENANWSSIPASLTSAALSDAYQPGPQRTMTATFKRFGTNALGFGGGDVGSELFCGVPFFHHFVTCLKR
jgi:hypothetical protein